MGHCVESPLIELMKKQMSSIEFMTISNWTDETGSQAENMMNKESEHFMKCPLIQVMTMKLRSMRVVFVLHQIQVPMTNRAAEISYQTK
jgi:hypothetical protein